MTKIHTCKFVLLSELTEGLPGEFVETIMEHFPVTYGDASHTLCGLDTLILEREDNAKYSDTPDSFAELTDRIQAAKEAGVEYVDLEN